MTPRLVFTGVLKYAYELLTLDTFMKLPGDLQVGEQTMHTFVNKSYNNLTNPTDVKKQIPQTLGKKSYRSFVTSPKA